jgi:transposase
MEARMASREVAVKRYVVRLSAEERERLEGLRKKGEIPATRLTKVQILLKADISAAGEGWSDSEIVKGLDATASMVYRTRRQLVEEGLEAVLSRKARETPPVPRIFDGEKEAKLIALACSDPPAGFARWSLRLLEEKVVELQIVDRASDSTIGRVLKKHPQAPHEEVLGDSAGGQRRLRRGNGGGARGLPAAARPQAPAHLSRRDVEAVDFRDARPDPHQAGEPRPL